MKTRHDFRFKYNPDSDDTLVIFPANSVCDDADDDIPVYVQIGHKTLTRLLGRCFRGRDVCKAGNFFCVSNIVQFMSVYRDAVDQLISDALRRHPSEDYFEAGLEYVCDEFIGWSSTDDLIEAYAPHELEDYHPNAHSSVMRVRLDAHRRAPLTTMITLVCGFFRTTDDEGRPCVKVTIFSMYPGENVGELDRDMTDEFVMFDWENPGEPLDTEQDSIAA